MSYTRYELLWFFLLYSFIGWCAEVVVAAAKRHKFINRGFVNGPMCPIYGVGAVAFAVFLPELKDNFFFLFLGGMILASFIEYITGRLLEQIFHRKWWDYSGNRFNLDGYICLKTSFVWGISAMAAIWFINPFICWILEKIPSWMDLIIVWAASVLLAVDYIGSGIAVLGLKKNKKISQITAELHKTSKLLENALTRHIQRRIVKAYPNIDEKVPAEDVFAEGCGYYKLVSLFFIGAVLGDGVETVWMLLTAHKLVCRSSVVYGPFSVVWGFACVLLTMILYRLKDKGMWTIFIWGTVLGGAYEYVCSVFTERAFGTVFWDYGKFALNLGGRINLLFCVLWGLASVLWVKLIYPRLSRWIEKFPSRQGKVVCNIMVIFMIANILISAMALGRYTQRYLGEEPQNQVEEFLDEKFPDERMERIYPYAKFRV